METGQITLNEDEVRVLLELLPESPNGDRIKEKLFLKLSGLYFKFRKEAQV